MHRRYRILARLGLLLASTFAVFALLEAAPGGLSAVYLQNPGAGAGDLAVLKSEFGPNRPLYAQYAAWLFRVLRGDLGWSPSNSLPVSQAVGERLPATIELAVVALGAVITTGAIVGFVRARVRLPVLRGIAAVSQLVCRAIPIVILTVAVQFLFMFTTSLPLAGIASVDTFDARDRFVHLIGPVLCLAMPFGAWSSLIFYDFFRSVDNAARISARSLIGPAASTAALIGPALLAATLIIEPPYAWPGAARLFYNGLSQHDLGLIAGLLLVYSVGVVLLELCAELAPDVGQRTSRRTGSPLRSETRRKRFSAPIVIALIVLVSTVLAALAADVLAPAGPYFIDQLHWEGYPLAPGVAGHLIGTDENGRDLLARVLVGLRTSLGIAALAAVIATAIGAVFARATKAVPWLDDSAALSVIGIRPFAAFPFILAVILVLVASHGIAALSPVVIALIIGVLAWPAIVPAFRALAPATLSGVVGVAGCALLLEFTISGHGFGVQPPTPSLGNMLVNMQSTLTIAPWIAITAGGVAVALLCAFYALADALRERA